MAKKSYKLPKKPTYKKHPAKPKKPKGGIKTEAQLKAWEQKTDVYSKKCAEIDKINKKLKADYDKKVFEIEKQKKADAKKETEFKKRIEKANKKMNTCSI